MDGRHRRRSRIEIRRNSDGEDLVRDHDRRHGSWPTGVKGEVDDHLFQLSLGHAVDLGDAQVNEDRGQDSLAAAYCSSVTGSSQVVPSPP